MKKQVKRLNLNKETLRALETPELRRLGAGAPTDRCVTNDPNSPHCNSEGLRCNPSYTTCDSMYC